MLKVKERHVRWLTEFLFKWLNVCCPSYPENYIKRRGIFLAEVAVCHPGGGEVC